MCLVWLFRAAVDKTFDLGVLLHDFNGHLQAKMIIHVGIIITFNLVSLQYILYKTLNVTIMMELF